MFNVLMKPNLLKQLEREGYYLVAKSDGKELSIFNKFSHPVTTFVQAQDGEVLILTKYEALYVERIELMPRFPGSSLGYAFSSYIRINGEVELFDKFYDPDHEATEAIENIADLQYWHWYNMLNDK